MRWMLFLLAATALPAHDITFAVYAERSVAAVRWTYAGEDPVRFAAVSVFAPGETVQRYQTGRTDANGTFAFVPSKPGKWKVAVDDEEGHKAEAIVEVGDDAAPITASVPQPLWAKWLTGLGTIAGLTGIGMAWRSRRP